MQRLLPCLRALVGTMVVDLNMHLLTVRRIKQIVLPFTIVVAIVRIITRSQIIGREKFPSPNIFEINYFLSYQDEIDL